MLDSELDAMEASRKESKELLEQFDLDTERDRLREALEDYGQHNPGCSGGIAPYPCKCGWTKFRAALGAKGQGE